VCQLEEFGVFRFCLIACQLHAPVIYVIDVVQAVYVRRHGNKQLRTMIVSHQWKDYTEGISYNVWSRGLCATRPICISSNSGGSNKLPDDFGQSVVFTLPLDATSFNNPQMNPHIPKLGISWREVISKFLYVLLIVHFDIWAQWNQMYALFIFSLLSHYTSTCFGLASCPSSGGNSVYSICDSWYVLYVLVDSYQLSHTYIVTSWWWATSKPETCRGIVTG
jgi:hypothetical protein